MLNIVFINVITAFAFFTLIMRACIDFLFRMAYNKSKEGMKKAKAPIIDGDYIISEKLQGDASFLVIKEREIKS